MKDMTKMKIGEKTELTEKDLFYSLLGDEIILRQVTYTFTGKNGIKQDIKISDDTFNESDYND